MNFFQEKEREREVKRGRKEELFLIVKLSFQVSKARLFHQFPFKHSFIIHSFIRPSEFNQDHLYDHEPGNTHQSLVDTSVGAQLRIMTALPFRDLWLMGPVLCRSTVGSNSCYVVMTSLPLPFPEVNISQPFYSYIFTPPILTLITESQQ